MRMITFLPNRDEDLGKEEAKAQFVELRAKG